MITLMIDVTKINKDRLYVGKKGTYLNCILVETPDSEYGDYMVVESISIEERQAGKMGAILGNGKIRGKGNVEATPQSDEPKAEGSDDLPF